MTLTIEEKRKKINELIEKLKNSKVIILTEYQGLNVPQMSKLREGLKEKKILFKVVKNTLMEKACREVQIKGLSSELVGTTAIVLSSEDVIEPARLLKEYMQKEKIGLRIKSGFIEGRYVDEGKVMEIASLPSRDMLIAKAIGGIRSPLYRFAFALQGPMRDLVLTLNALKEKREA